MALVQQFKKARCNPIKAIEQRRTIRQQARAEADAKFGKFWELSFEEYAAAWKATPAALPANCATDTEIIDEAAPVRDGIEIRIRICKPKSVKPNTWLFLTCHGGHEKH
jgi:hypothetical protein